MEQLFRKFNQERDKNPWDGHYSGVYRGKILETNDPLRMRRLRVLIPDLYKSNEKAENVLWATMANWFGGGPSAGSWVSPSIGDLVWVAFERGHPYSPVVIGFADSTRNKSYVLDGIYGPPPTPINGEKPRYNNGSYLPKDERPYNMGFRSPYGQEIIFNYTGFFPKAHENKPANAGVDAVSEKDFEVSQKAPEANSPDTKHMAFISGYGTTLIMSDAGHNWKSEDVQNEEYIKNRYEYNLEFLNESAPKDRDQRRFEIRTRAGHKFEMRDVGFNKSRPGEYLGKSFSIVATAEGGEEQDERWVKIRTKGGHLFQMMDVGFQKGDSFYSRLNKSEFGSDEETTDIGLDGDKDKSKDKRIIRLQTRHGHRILLDDRGSSSTSAENAQPRGIGIAMQTRRGHYLGMCDRDEYSSIVLHSAEGQGLVISDTQKYVALSTQLPTPISPTRVGIYGAEWPTIPWELYGERTTYNLILDAQNNRIAFKTPTREGTDYGIEFSDAAEAQSSNSLPALNSDNDVNSEDAFTAFADEANIKLNKINKNLASMQSDMANELLAAVSENDRCNTSWGEIRDKRNQGIYLNTDDLYAVYHAAVSAPLSKIAALGSDCNKKNNPNPNPNPNPVAIFMEEPLRSELGPATQEELDRQAEEALAKDSKPIGDFVVEVDNSRKKSTDPLENEEADRYIIFDDKSKQLQIANKDGNIFINSRDGIVTIEAKKIIFGASEDIVFRSRTGKISMVANEEGNKTHLTVENGVVGTNKNMSCDTISAEVQGLEYTPGNETTKKAPIPIPVPPPKSVIQAVPSHKPTSPLFPKSAPCCGLKFIELYDYAQIAIRNFNENQKKVEEFKKIDGDIFRQTKNQGLDNKTEGAYGDFKRAEAIKNNLEAKRESNWKKSGDAQWPGYGYNKDGANGYKTLAQAKAAAKKEFKKAQDFLNKNQAEGLKAYEDQKKLRQIAEDAINAANEECAYERCERIKQNTKDKKDKLEKAKKEAIEALKKLGVKNAETLSQSGISQLNAQQQGTALFHKEKVEEARKNFKAAEADEKARCSKKKGAKLTQRGCAPNRSESGKIPPMTGNGGISGSIPVIVNNKPPASNPPDAIQPGNDDDQIPDDPEVVDPPPFEPPPPDPADDLIPDDQGGSSGGVLWYGVSETWLQEIVDKGLLVSSLANIQNDPNNSSTVAEFIELATSPEDAQGKEFLQISQNRYGGKGIILRIKNISDIGVPIDEDDQFSTKDGGLLIGRTIDNSDIEGDFTIKTFHFYADIPPKYIEIYQILPELPASSVPIVKK